MMVTPSERKEMIIIGFGHRKQVGKDTAARFLATLLRTWHKGLKVVRQGFASGLKAQCHQLYGWAGLKEEQYYEDNPDKKSTFLFELNQTVRDVWLKYGTLVCREIYPDTWLNFLFKVVKADILLIPDMRFENEFDGVKRNGGITIKINRPSIPITDDIADKPLAGYSDDTWDCVIQNDGSLNDLNDQVIQIYDKLIKDKLKR